MRSRFLSACAILAVFMQGPSAAIAGPPQRQHSTLTEIGNGATPPSLPLRVPIKGVMDSIIDFSAHGIFTTATSEEPLSDRDWLAAGLAAINLISSATLITSPGAGPNDEAWIRDPEWRLWAAAYQKAGVSAAIAIRRRDRNDFLAAANDLADACQSCHQRFRITDQRSNSQFAEGLDPRALKELGRAWPQPGY